MAIEKGRAASASTPTAPWDTLPRLIISSLRPGKRASPPTGATALLVQHEPNHHSHNDAANHLDSDVPEEVSHGVPSFQESAPQQVFYPFPMLLSKNRYQNAEARFCLSFGGAPRIGARGPALPSMKASVPSTVRQIGAVGTPATKPIASRVLFIVR